LLTVALTACGPGASIPSTGGHQANVVFACASSGGIAGLEAGSSAPWFENLGTAPQALAQLDGVLLDLDGSDNRLYEAEINGFAQLTESPVTNTYPSSVLVDKNKNVYVTNSQATTLQVLQPRGAGVSGETYVPAVLDGGLGLQTVAVLELPAGGNAEYMALLNGNLFVSLYKTGQVAQVDVTNPLNPTLVATYDMTSLNLNTFPGAPVAPVPWGIAAFQNKVYVALQNSYYNSTTGTLAAAGDGGLLGVIDPSGGTVSVVDVGSNNCLEPTWLTPSSDGSLLLLSCAGQVETSGPPSFNTVGVDRAAVVALNAQNQTVGLWNCSSAGLDSGCNTFSPNASAVSGTLLYAGDAAYGRAIALDFSSGALTEVAGFGPGKAPLKVCPLSPLGNGNISNVLAL
jgi:hypothetical protein